MIIEAGYDLSQIIDPYVHDRKRPNALWMILLDDELRLLRVRKVVRNYGGSAQPHLAQIAKKLEGEGTVLRPQYFALAHHLDRVHDVNIAEKVDEDDRFLEDAPSLAAFGYLGRLVVDGKYAYESWPRYRFRDYIGREDLPRAASIPGPHPCGCQCVACSQFLSRLDAAHERRTRGESPAIDGPPDD